MSYSFLFLLLLSSLSVVYYTWRNGIGPTSSTRKARRLLLAQIAKDFSGTAIELGCGWGALLFPLLRRCPEATVIAYENSLVPYLFSRVRSLFFWKNSLAIIRANFYHLRLTNASLVICYLFPEAMERLREKFEQELTIGTVVVSNTFAIPGWRPEVVINVGDWCGSKVYVYRYGSHNI